jgi:Domain of unknown function (DUF4291)
MSSTTVPFRQIRAVQTEHTITVYQAFREEIAEPAVRENRLVPPFQRGRMTWIKASFLWMAYRSGYATKEHQERVLGIEITKAGFEWALEHSSLSHFEAETYADRAAWETRKSHSPVRVQWDPERDLDHEPLAHRSIQIGLSGEAVTRYVDEWTVSITDHTALCHEIHRLVQEHKHDEATNLLPVETVFELSDHLATTLGSTSQGP